MAIRFRHLLLLLLPAFPALADDKAFLQAREAFQKGNAAKLAALAAELQDDSLKIYADYYQLSLQSDTLQTLVDPHRHGAVTSTLLFVPSAPRCVVQPGCA